MSAMTYTHANRTESGWVGVVTSDPDGDHPLYESAAVQPTEEDAEAVACWEWFEVLDLPRLESPEEVLR